MDDSLEEGLIASYEAVQEAAQSGDYNAGLALAMVDWNQDSTDTLYMIPSDPDEVQEFIERFSNSMGLLLWARIIAYLRREGSPPTHVNVMSELGFESL